MCQPVHACNGDSPGSLLLPLPGAPESLLDPKLAGEFWVLCSHADAADKPATYITMLSTSW